MDKKYLKCAVNVIKYLQCLCMMTGKYFARSCAMNSLEKLAPYIVLILSILFLNACGPHKSSKVINPDSKARTPQCLAQQNPCQFDLGAGQVQVLFNVDKVIAEQPFTMLVNYHGSEKIANITGYLEGGDMFMGKIPLFIEQRLLSSRVNKPALENIPTKQTVQHQQDNNQVFQADVLVGSCSAEQMTWHIWLTFTTVKNTTYHKMLTIVSYRR
jgi:hypothetical protein